MRHMKVTRLAVLTLLAAVVVAPSPATAATAKQRSKAVKWALKQNGHQEVGTTNRSTRIDKWTRAMGLEPGVAWCGSFVHHAFLRAGVRLSERLIEPDLSYSDAKARKRGLRAIPLRKVRRGDLLFFQFRKDLRASHLAIATGKLRGGSFRTIEGNVSHAVQRRVRGASYPVLAARVTAR